MKKKIPIRIFAAVLAASLVFQTTIPAAAQSELVSGRSAANDEADSYNADSYNADSYNADSYNALREAKMDSFHYVAVGDSVAAGFDLDTSSPLQRLIANYPEINYNHCSPDSYPARVAARLKDVLVEDGTIAEAEDFSFANMGMAGYRIESVTSAINDPDFILDFYYATRVDPYVDMIKYYETMDHEQLEADVAAANKDIVKAMVDSVYFADDPDNEETADLIIRLTQEYDLWWETREEFETWYEANASTDEKYDAWFPAWHKDYFEHGFVDLIYSNKAKVHALLIDQLHQADLITFDLGSNNLLTTLLMWLQESTKGPDAVGYIDLDSDIVYYKNMENPILYLIDQLFVKFCMGEDYRAYIATLPTQLKLYRDQLTLSQLVEALNFFNPDNLDATMIDLVDYAMEQFPILIESMREINREGGKDAQIFFLNHYPGFGGSLEIDGVNHDLNYCIRTILSETRKMLLEDIKERCAGAEAESEQTKIVNWINMVLDTVEYPMMYLMAGQTAAKSIAYFNDRLEKLSEEEGFVLVDISGLPNENNIDPHPLASGQAYIANQILDTILPELSYETAEGGQITGPATCVHGHDVTFTFEAEEGWQLDRILANGEVVVEASAQGEEPGEGFDGNTFTLAHVTEDLAIKAVFVRTVPDEADAPAGDPTPDEPVVPDEDPMPGQPVNPGLCRLAALFNKLVKFRAVVLDLRQLLKAGAHSARNDGCWAGWLQSRTGWRPASVCA